MVVTQGNTINFVILEASNSIFIAYHVYYDMASYCTKNRAVESDVINSNLLLPCGKMYALVLVRE